jgi:hypothetical protein
VYTPVLAIHSWLRWITLLLAVGATMNAWRPDTDLSARPPGRYWDTFFMMALDFQVLFGLLLYFGLSPTSKFGLENMGAALQNSTIRFWTLDHIAWMTAATVLVRVGRVLAINAKTSATRRKWRFLFFALTTLTIIAGIPWPGLPYGRALFRFWELAT